MDNGHAYNMCVIYIYTHNILHIICTYNVYVCVCHNVIVINIILCFYVPFDW